MGLKIPLHDPNITVLHTTHSASPTSSADPARSEARRHCAHSDRSRLRCGGRGKGRGVRPLRSLFLVASCSYRSKVRSPEEGLMGARGGKG